MTIILNEARQAEYILEKGEISSKPASTLFLLGKYYSHKKKHDRDQICQKLNDFMEQYYKKYKPVLWESTIDHISKKACKCALREIDQIGITQTEMYIISQLRRLDYKKLMFSMLCHAKLFNACSPNNNNWVNTDIKELFKTARVTVKRREDKFLYLNDIEKEGFIRFSSKNSSLNMQVTFVDPHSETVLPITDFRELGYEYLNFIGKGCFIRCVECGRLIRKTNNRCLYCMDCKVEKQCAQKYDWYVKRKKSEI